MLRELWPQEVLSLLSIDEIVQDTQGWSFAELEEARKCAITTWLDHGRVNWADVREFYRSRGELAPSTKFSGFASASKHQEQFIPADIKAVN